MRILISTQMMIHDQDRFGKELSKYGYEVDFIMNNQFLSEAECLELNPVYDGWIAGDDQITKAVIDHFLPKLKVVSKWGTGVDSIDLEHAKKSGLHIANSPGAFKDAVGELAIAYLLILTRGVLDTHESVKAGMWPKRRYEDISNLTIGVIGMGAIGHGVATRVQSLGGAVIYSDPYSLDEDFTKVELNELLKNSDAIVVTCNLNDSTYHLLNSSAFSLCKKSPYLINVSRGPIVDEEALILALKNCVLSGAALDVYEVEPLSESSPLREFNNVIFGSHNANNTSDAVKFVHMNTIKNLVSALS